MELLLLHAGVADARMWGPLRERLDPGVRVVAPDLPGFGGAAADGTPPWDAAAAALDAAAVARAHVVGASYGGQVALELALAHPDRVASLVLLAAALPDHDWSPAMHAFGEAEEAALAAGDVAEAVEVNVRMWTADEATASLVRDMQARAFALQLAETARDAPPLEPPAGARLAEIGVPATVVTGGRDLEDFAVIGDRIAAALGAERHTLPGAGHLLALERPDEIAALVRAHLARVA